MTLNGMRIDIDGENGSLIGMSYPATGVILQSTDGLGGGVDVAYPVKAFMPLRLASRFSHATINQTPDGVVISYDQLAASRKDVPMPEGKVSAELRIKAADDGRSVIMSCSIENNSSQEIPQVLFPDLHGLRPFGRPDDMRLRMGRGVVKPFLQPAKPAGSAHFYGYRNDTMNPPGWEVYPSDNGYQSFNSCRWVDYGSYTGGLSIFQKRWDGTRGPTLYTNRSHTDSDCLRLIWEHRVTVKPGERWDSDEYWFTPHPGGWAKGIEVFRNYVSAMNPLRELPEHVRDGIGYRTIWMIDPMEYRRSAAHFTFADLPEVAADAKAHGIDEVVIWGWETGCHLPVRSNDLLGTPQEFVDGVQKARALGVNMAPFISVTLLRRDIASKYDATFFEGANWTYHPDMMPVFSPYYANYYDEGYISPKDEKWRQDVLSALKEWIDLGVCSFSWDVFKPNSEKGEKPPVLDLAEKIRAAARSGDPESTFSGESTATVEMESRVLDYTWNWVDYTSSSIHSNTVVKVDYVDPSPLLNVLRAPRFAVNVDDCVLSLKKAFCDGIYINIMPRTTSIVNGSAYIRDIPEIAEALKEVSPLRRKFLDYYTQGTLIGDSFLSDAADAHVSGHLLGNRLLIAVLNDKDHEQSVTLKGDLSLWLPPDHECRVIYYDSSGKERRVSQDRIGRWIGVTENLRPLELAFFEISSTGDH